MTAKCCASSELQHGAGAKHRNDQCKHEFSTKFSDFHANFDNFFCIFDQALFVLYNELWHITTDRIPASLPQWEVWTNELFVSFKTLHLLNHNNVKNTNAPKGQNRLMN